MSADVAGMRVGPGGLVDWGLVDRTLGTSVAGRVSRGALCGMGAGLAGERVGPGGMLVDWHFVGTAPLSPGEGRLSRGALSEGLVVRVPFVRTGRCAVG